jgi:hypothetical protein
MNKYFLLCLFTLLYAMQVGASPCTVTNGEVKAIVDLGDDGKFGHPRAGKGASDFSASSKDGKGVTVSNKFDLSKDGNVNMIDVNILVDHILGKSIYDGNADINGDKQVSIADVVQLVNFILNGKNIIYIESNLEDIFLGGGGSEPARSRQLDDDDNE